MSRKIAILPGRFQPFHKGHKFLYDWLVKRFGEQNVYISTSDVVDAERSPFSFEDKKKMMELTGIPSDRILKVTSNYNIKNISELVDVDLKNDYVFFALSDKDMLEDPRFKNFKKKDGSPTYLQPVPNKSENLKTAKIHSYLIVVPTVNFKVMNTSVKSATQIRNMFFKLSDDKKKNFVVDLFGKFDEEILSILDKKLSKTLNEDVFADKIQSLMKKKNEIQYNIEKLKYQSQKEKFDILSDRFRLIKNPSNELKSSVDIARKQVELAKKRMDDANKRKSKNI